MSAKNVYHDTVVRALIADGWTITDDPLRVTYGQRGLSIDLGAGQNSIGAERVGRRIAVEIQSFLHPSPIYDLERAVGQFVIYRLLLAELDPERILYLAVPTRVDEGLFSEPFGEFVLTRLQMRRLAFDVDQQRIVKWTE